MMYNYSYRNKNRKLSEDYSKMDAMDAYKKALSQNSTFKKLLHICDKYNFKLLNIFLYKEVGNEPKYYLNCSIKSKHRMGGYLMCDDRSDGEFTVHPPFAAETGIYYFLNNSLDELHINFWKFIRELYNLDLMNNLPVYDVSTADILL